MKHFCKIWLFLLLFPIVVFGQSELDMLPVQHHIVEGLSPIMLFGRNKLCTIPVYKISKSNIKRHLKKEIRKAYDYLDNDKKNIYYGIIVLTHYPQKGDVYSFEVWRKKQYDLFCPIWGVAYVSGMPIFFIGEENLRFLKPMNKRTCYNMKGTVINGVEEPYMSFFRVVTPQSKKVKTSDKQKDK